ncbi:fumarate/nitrate reduction transcriptional regulator Fnr [Thiomicrorhabdus sp. 6S3-12]|uniref:fumarate/nitrate reduction transcriptional regulator Fnr n=1 Tax=Thiomicrorhabdus sp. 6S3-12 TaxID=2819681 RepID=UPI001AACBED4|nr:fumarate/nitrate reduction transcriptional regulator Fnr [Thiomicrorhabdus sp. 6S3-12]MBO1924481.1 fumarate/nitrate reduction transcriptional regulator Fnr [Thiomicrorhabdus sp. 6S3-12]
MKEVKSAFNVSCKNCGLQKVCFPTGLRREDVDRLDDIVDRRSPLKKGQHLFEASDKFSALFAIRAGVIKLYSFTDGGEEIVHGFYLPGDVLGIDALGSKQHQYSAVALDTTSVCTLPFEKFTELTESIPNLNQQMLNAISKEVLDGRMHSELLIRRNADQRVAQFVWNMSERYRNRGYASDEFRLSILHRDVAVYLGLTPETVSRILAKFHAENIVTWKKKEVMIHDMQRLMHIAGVHSSCDSCKATA